MKIGLLGGTFDPIHKGHILMAEKALKEFNLHSVIFLPSANPPHKKEKEVTDFNIRYEMCLMALKDYDDIFVNPIEANRKGYSYTVDTLKEFRNIYNKGEFYFIIGGDSLFEIESWKSVEELFKLTSFIVFRRMGDMKETKNQYEKLKMKYDSSIYLSNEEIPAVSSTDIRSRLLKGEDISEFVTKEVERYIVEHGLYKE